MRKFLAVALVFAIVLSVAVLPVFVSDVHASPDWLTGWSYRKSHVINNATGAGTNYQVKIKADFGKKVTYDANTTLSTKYCHGLIYYNNYLYGCQRYPPGKVFKVSADLSSSLVVTVTRDGTEAGQLADIIQAGGYIWVGDSSGYLYKLSPSDLSTVNYYSVVSSVIDKICFDGTYIFGCTANGEVFKFNVNTAEVTVQQIQSGNIFHSLVEDGSYLYVSDIENYWIRKIAKSDLSQVSYVSVGYRLTDDMAQDATYIFGGIEESTGGIVRVQKSDLSVYTYRGPSFGQSYGVFSSGSYILNLDQAKGILWVHSCPDLAIVRKIYLELYINELAEDESYYYLSVYKTSETPLKKISKTKIYSLPGEVSGLDDLVYLDSKCKPDFGDLRFTKSDGVTLLDYWLETKVDGDLATFWVEVGDDLSSSSATIYVYYGKSDATTTSNGENTFLFFDDFNVDLSKWTQRSGTWTISDGNLVSPMLDNSQIVTNSFSAYNVRIRAYFKVTWETNKNALAIIARTPDLSNLVKIQYQPGATTPEFNMFKRINGVWTKLDYEYVTADQNYHTYEFLLYGSSLKGYRDGAAEITGTESTLTSNPIGFRHGGSNTGSRGYVDWVFAAKYVSPEPSHGSWGSEETSGGGWHNVEQWWLNLRSPAWFSAETWFLTLRVPAWFNVEGWSCSLHTFKWFNVEQWMLTLRNPVWCTAENWMLSLHTLKWFTIEQWMLTLRNPIWNFAEQWILTLKNYSWFHVETWMLQTGVAIWNAIETWMIQVGTGMWNTVETWIIKLRNPTWYIAEQWILTLRNPIWNTIETWFINIGTGFWNTVETWILNIAIPTPTVDIALALAVLAFILAIAGIAIAEERR